jgi:hypothetical protein
MDNEDLFSTDNELFTEGGDLYEVEEVYDKDEVEMINKLNTEMDNNIFTEGGDLYEEDNIFTKGGDLYDLFFAGGDKDHVAVNKKEILNKIGEFKNNKNVHPLIKELHIDSDCAVPVKHAGDSCLPENVKKHILKENDVKSMNDAKKKLNCDSEKCVAIRTDSKYENFYKPAGPKGVTKWLNNYNIDEVLRRWAFANSKFLHVPFHMRDFEGKSLYKIDWSDAIKKYDSVACVINTDKYGGKGKHWVCVYVDLVDKTIEYFDSGGREPFSEVYEWMTFTKDRLAQAGVVCVLKTKLIQHQQQRTECGIYCIYFINARLHYKISYDEFRQDIIPDQIIMGSRLIFFVED